VREALLDADPLTRKRAAFLARAGLLSQVVGSQGLPDGWAALFSLLEILDDSPWHLVAEAWPQHLLLLPARGTTWRHGSGYGAAPGDADPWGEVAPLVHAPLPFIWSRAVLVKGLTHLQPRVRKLVLKSIVDTSKGTAGVSVC
jgi:hypothetical protein